MYIHLFLVKFSSNLPHVGADSYRDWGVDKISLVSVLASEPGLEAAAQVWPEGTRFVTGFVDPEVDARGHIKPGLGDIGDRLFGTL